MSRKILQARDLPVALEPAITLSFRPLVQSDVVEMSRLHAKAYQDSGSSASSQLRLFWEGAYGDVFADATLGAWHKDTLVGAVIVLDKAPDEWCSEGNCNAPYIADIFVDPGFRRQGVAAALILKASAAVAQAGRETLTLQLDIAAAPEAMQLYDYLGFSAQ